MILKVRASPTLTPPTTSGSRLGGFAIGKVERRPCGELIEDRLQFDLLVEL
jgi:hypothetical protein